MSEKHLAGEGQDSQELAVAKAALAACPAC